MNNVQILGRITRELEIKEVGEVKILNFTVAVDRQKKDEVDFIPVTAFGKTAEILCKYCTKGNRVLVDGAIRIENFEDKEGNKRTNTKVTANHVTIIDFKDVAKEDTQGNPFVEENSDGLPF